jgi:signal transduction histidine kinase
MAGMSRGTATPIPDRRAGTSPVAFAIALGAFITLATTAIWAAAGGGYYWPCWVILGCLAALAPLVCWGDLRGRPNGPRTRVRWHAEISGASAGMLLLIWAFSGAQGPWVLWPVLSLALVLGLHALVDLRAEVPQLQTRELQERVDTLSRTRRQAVDAQAAELRRIERDLHDGAQARLVALTMQLGRAEAALAHKPAAAALVRAAREEATIAIKELRDLARGIAPPSHWLIAEAPR